MIARMDSMGIDLSGPCWTVAHIKGGLLGTTPAAHFRIDGETAERVEKLKAYMKEKRAGSASIALALPPADCLVKVLSLPSVGEKAISRMLGFELERHLPTEAQEWRWSYHVIKTEGASSIIMFTAVKAALADGIIETFETAGLFPSLVTSGQAALSEAVRRSGFIPSGGLSAIASVGGDGLTLQVFKNGVLLYSSVSEVLTARQAIGFAFSFVKEMPQSFIVIDEGPSEDAAGMILNDAQRLCSEAKVLGPVPALSRAFGAALTALENRAAGSLLDRDSDLIIRKRALAAAGAAMLVVFGAGASVAVKDIMALRGVEKEIALLGDERIKAEALMKEVESITADMKALEDIKGGNSPGFLDTLRRLTELTPEDTYLTGLEYGRDKIIVDGVSQKASGLFMKLTGSGFAEDINYDGPVLRGQDGKERFRIKFRHSGGNEDGDSRIGS